MKLKAVETLLREIAPLHLAEPWDKVGLHVGDPDQPVRRGMLCIDLTEAVMAEAVEQKANLIVAYHPPIFHALTTLTPETWKERVIREAVRRGIAIYSPHTALDNVRGGLADWLCDGLGEHKVRWTIKDHVSSPGQCKVVTYVPPEHADGVRQAMSEAGAGWIGNYSGCSFNAPGSGTFEPEAGAKPHVGRVGRLEWVDELRIEMICWQLQTGNVVHAIREAHPYEEPAIDVIDLADERPPEDDAPGAGRVHHLQNAVPADELVRRIKAHLGVERVKVSKPACANPWSDSPRRGRFRSIAVCPGAGGSVFEEYPAVDAYFTGEMQHHQVLDMASRGQLVILAGHTNTERPYLKVLRQRLARGTGRALSGP